MTRMAGPDCVVMCHVINTYIQYIYTHQLHDPIPEEARGAVRIRMTRIHRGGGEGGMRENPRNDERGKVEDGKELSSQSRKSRLESISEAVETERSMPAIREQESGEGSARRWRATVGL